MAGPSLVGLGAGNPLERTGARVLSQTQGPATQGQTFTLIERVASAFRAWKNPGGKPAVDTDISTLDSGTPVSGKTLSWQEYFRIENTRLQVYEDAKEMDESTDEVAAALDTLADSSVNPEDGAQYTFMIEIDDGPYRDQAQQIFDQVAESCDLHSNAFPIARDTLKYGDTFLELVVDDQRQLSRIKFLPPTSMWRNEDASGNLMEGRPRYSNDSQGNQICSNLPGECAYDQREALNGRILAAFYSWQICHVRWSRRGSERYGRSLLRTARLVWKKLRASEEALVIARLQRAWMRFVHYVDTTGMTAAEARNALWDYRQQLTRRFVVDTQLRESPFEVTSDFYVSAGHIRDLDGAKYLPRQSKIEVLQGDHAVLAHITDIEYFQNKLFASLRVPKAYIGFERDINAKSTLTTQDIQFARVLRRIQQVLSQAYKEIFDFALVLAGLDPAQVSYTVRWPAILVSDEERDAIIRRFHAQADAVYWQMGAPSTKYIVQERYGMDDEAWMLDLLDAKNDPPARIKIPTVQMPPTPMMVATPGAPTLDAAIAAAQKEGPITDLPPDAFDQNQADTAAAKDNVGIGQRRNPKGGLVSKDQQPGQGGGTSGGQRLGTEEAEAAYREWVLEHPREALLEEDSDLDGDYDGLEDDLLALGFDQNRGLVPGLGPITRYQYVPGRGRADASSDAERTRRQQRVGTVTGVHAVSTLRGSGRGLPMTSAHVAGAASRQLSGFMVNLAERKRAVADRRSGRDE